MNEVYKLIIRGMDVVNYLKKIDNKRDKNRFVHTLLSSKTNWFKRPRGHYKKN